MLRISMTGKKISAAPNGKGRVQMHF